LSTSSSEEGGACYIYGSEHTKIPREDILERLVGRVDYVLLEGVSISGLWRLARKHPSIALSLVFLVAFLKFENLLARIKGLLHRLLRRGVKFVGDMEYVRDFFASRDPRISVETADASLEELVEARKELFVIMVIPAVVITVVLPYALYVMLCFLLYGFSLLLSYLGLVREPLMICELNMISVGLAGLALGFLTIVAARFFIRIVLELSSIRDRKLVDRVVELVRCGYRVLVVRGRKHVPYIREELRKRGVDCEVLNPG